MLLFDDSKKLEKALGEEAAAVIAHVFEKADEKSRQDFEKSRQELATRADLVETSSGIRAEVQAVRDKLAHTATKAELAAMENRLIKWMIGGFIAQTALLVAVLAFLR